MAISAVAQVPGLTAEEDAALVEALDLEGSPPAGGRIRLDGPAGGGRRIVGLWDSSTDYERFRDDRLIPALSGLGRALQVIEKRPATETVRILPGDLISQRASHMPPPWPDCPQAQGR